MDCKVCVKNAKCDEGGDVVKVKKGYWTDPQVYSDNRSTTITVLRCESADTCCENEEGCKVDEQCKEGLNGEKTTCF